MKNLEPRLFLLSVLLCVFTVPDTTLNASPLSGLIKNKPLPVQPYTNSAVSLTFDKTSETDTFPLRTLFKRKEKKEEFLQDDTSASLFPDSKSYRTPYKCKVAFEGMDPMTGERKKELVPEPFLSYTAANVKPYLPGKDLLQATAQLIRFSGGYVYFSVQFTWDAKNPNSAYGRLKSNGAIRCYLTGKKSVTLYNTKESIWHKADDNTSHTLQALFLLHPKQVKLLKEHSIMKIKVFWECGFEEYPVYPITIFMDQLKCLE